MICCKMRKLSYVVASVLVLAICGIVSATDDTSLLNDPTNDLIYIYTGVPVPPENYVGYVDVVMAEANKTEGSLDFFVTTNSGIPPMENATFWTVLMDGDNVFYHLQLCNRGLAT
jgi:hypothetical protein